MPLQFHHSLTALHFSDTQPSRSSPAPRHPNYQLQIPIVMIGRARRRPIITAPQDLLPYTPVTHEAQAQSPSQRCRECETVGGLGEPGPRGGASWASERKSKGGPNGPYETSVAVSDAQASDRPREAPTRIGLPQTTQKNSTTPPHARQGSVQAGSRNANKGAAKEKRRPRINESAS